MRHLHLLSVRQQMIVDPAGKNRCLHSNCPWLRKSLYPRVQFPPCCSDLAFLVDLATRILYAIADRLLVNIQPDVIHTVHEEPPWLFSESTFPLSSAFVHHALLPDLAFKQYVQVTSPKPTSDPLQW